MLQPETGTLKIMDIETGKEYEVSEIPKLATGGMIDEPVIGVDLVETCKASISVIINPKGKERFIRFLLKGTNNNRKKHHIPMLRKIYR